MELTSRMRKKSTNEMLNFEYAHQPIVVNVDRRHLVAGLRHGHTFSVGIRLPRPNSDFLARVEHERRPGSFPGVPKQDSTVARAGREGVLVAGGYTEHFTRGTVRFRQRLGGAQEKRGLGARSLEVDLDDGTVGTAAESRRG